MTAAAAAPVRMAPGSWTFLAVSVPDLPSSTSWYAKVFGLTKGFTYRSPDDSVQIQILTSDELTVELQRQATAQPTTAPPGKAYLRHGIFKVGVRVLNLVETIATLKALGVSVLVEPFDDPDGRYASAVIQDNSGNSIQLFQRRSASKTQPHTKREHHGA